MPPGQAMLWASKMNTKGDTLSIRDVIESLKEAIPQKFEFTPAQLANRNDDSIVAEAAEVKPTDVEVPVKGDGLVAENEPVATEAEAVSKEEETDEVPGGAKGEATANDVVDTQEASEATIEATAADDAAVVEKESEPKGDAAALGTASETTPQNVPEVEQEVSEKKAEEIAEGNESAE